MPLCVTKKLHSAELLVFYTYYHKSSRHMFFRNINCDFGNHPRYKIPVLKGIAFFFCLLFVRGSDYVSLSVTMPLH
jgi:hypothetical protein